MAVVRIPDEDRTIENPAEVKDFLGKMGITYEQWEPARDVGNEATAEEVLEAYKQDVERMKNEGGYVAADVIDVTAETPNLQAMLDKFNKEHWHDEDEVRFILEGRGVFHLNLEGHPVCSVEVTTGDLLRVPRGRLHWFDLCNE